MLLFGHVAILAQAQSGFHHPPAQAPTDSVFPQADASGGGKAAAAATSPADEAADLAKKLQNPVANLISVPIQNNWDFGIGLENAMRYTANIQPVLPFSLNKDWNLITRTIAPIIYAEATTSSDTDEWGLGDILQSFFLSPKEPVGGWIIGAGPALLYPTATDSALGAGQWSAGPTAVALRQEHGFTYGILANHLWSYAGWTDNTVDATFLQPFLSYTTKASTTFTLNMETTYDWDRSQWSVPINAMVAQLVKIWKQPMQFQVGGRYYAEGPKGGPDWGLRFAITLLFPK